MTVKAYLALLVGVFVVALVAVSVVQRDLAGDLAGVARDVTRSHAPRARAAHELRAAHLAERRALAGFLLAAEPADSARLQQARRDLRRWRGDLGAHLTSEDQAPLAEIDRLVAEEQAVADQAVELRRSGRAAEARELGGREADPPGERVDQLLAQLSDTTSRELDTDAARAERTAAAAGRRTVLLPLLVILAVAGFALWLVRRVLRDLARPFHAAGINIRSNADQLSAAVQQLATTTAEQSSGVAQTSATMEELARAAASIAETVDHVASQAGTTRDNLEQARYDIRASGERTLALADRVGEVGVTIALINEIADQTNLLALNAAIEAAPGGRRRPRVRGRGRRGPPPGRALQGVGGRHRQGDRRRPVRVQRHRGQHGAQRPPDAGGPEPARRGRRRHRPGPADHPAAALGDRAGGGDDGADLQRQRAGVDHRPADGRLGRPAGLAG